MKKKLLCLLLALCTLFLLTTAVCAAEPQLSPVTDDAGLLTNSQAQRLEQMAAALADRYDVGIYIVTVADYHSIDPAGVYEATYGVYHAYTMGEGSGRDGLMLLLSMRERDYALFCYGNDASYAFSDYGMAQLEEVFLDNFRENDWYGGFEDYIRECGAYLEKAAAGQPVRESPAGMILVFAVIALVIALIVCLILVGQMKSVRKQTTAGAYAVGGLNLTRQVDLFTHRTESRRRIQESSSSSGGGGQRHSGGGGSCRSGKF